MRNAMIPVLTILGMQFSFLLAGADIVLPQGLDQGRSHDAGKDGGLRQSQRDGRKNERFKRLGRVAPARKA
ncbi:hypothetical protein, partial [Bacillus cereus group sp. Bce004]|uniref:hypothetical protein n=1 Tax=Bacillus cereus group sp. Bce004 TaxID=3445257 RepID=UPI003F22FA24